MGSPDPAERSAGHQPPEQRTRPVRIRFLFLDRYDWLGPAIIALSSWYFASQVWVAWLFRPEYSFVSNAISDLGNTACRTPPSGFCSPLWVVMDISIPLLGLAMFFGSILIFTEFSFSEHPRERRAALGGFACMALAGVVPSWSGSFLRIGIGSLAHGGNCRGNRPWPAGHFDPRPSAHRDWWIGSGSS